MLALKPLKNNAYELRTLNSSYVVFLAENGVSNITEDGEALSSELYPLVADDIQETIVAYPWALKDSSIREPLKLLSKTLDLRFDFEEDDFQEPQTMDLSDLAVAFKTGWGGKPDKRQKKALSKYGLEFIEAIGTGYNRIVRGDNPDSFVTVSKTPSAQNAGKNVFRDLRRKFF